MTPENSIQNFPGFPRISQDFPGFPRIFQNEYCDFIKKMASMCSKQSRNEQEVIMTPENSIQDFPGFPKISQDFPEFSRINIVTS